MVTLSYAHLFYADLRQFVSVFVILTHVGYKEMTFKMPVFKPWENISGRMLSFES